MSDRSAESNVIVTRIDHILVLVDDLDPLFGLFVDTFKLPVAWPIHRNNPRFQGGGVAFGNVNVEVLRFLTPMGPLREEPLRAHLYGLAFEPVPFVDGVPELQRRGVAHEPPFLLERTFPDGHKEPISTIVRLAPQFGGDDAWMFMLSQYAHNVPVRRAERRAELRGGDGGPLGLVGIHEVVIGARDFPDAMRRWEALLDPNRQMTPGHWQLGDGPTLRLVAADRDRMQRLVIEVSSLTRARDFLRQLGLLGSDGSELSIDQGRVNGLDIRIVGGR